MRILITGADGQLAAMCATPWRDGFRLVGAGALSSDQRGRGLVSTTRCSPPI